jgi:hypothetical protein
MKLRPGRLGMGGGPMDHRRLGRLRARMGLPPRSRPACGDLGGRGVADKRIVFGMQDADDTRPCGGIEDGEDRGIGQRIARIGREHLDRPEPARGQRGQAVGREPGRRVGHRDMHGIIGKRLPRSRRKTGV